MLSDAISKRNLYALPGQAHLVSRVDVGIYLFSLRFPSDLELGLKSDVLTSEKYQMIAENLASFLTQRNKILYAQRYAGYVERTKTAHHLRGRLPLEGTSAYQTVTAEEILANFRKCDKDLLVEDFRAVTFLFRQSAAYAPPLYVGITRNQSFRMRLMQHMNGQSGFANKLESLRISWSDLKLETLSVNLDLEMNLSWAETIVQSMVQPALSDA